MKTVQSYTIDASREHCITYHEVDPNDPRIVITFSPLRGGMGPLGFGSEFCLKHGWNHIYVGKQNGTRFRSLEPERLEEATRPYTTGRDVVVYGSSLGAYAAFYYGGALGARILAASPRNPGHPLLRSDKPTSYHHILNLCDRPRSAHTPVIVYDPDEIRDRIMVTKWVLPAYSSPRIIPVYNSGHFSLLRLKKAGALRQLVRDFVDGVPLGRICSQRVNPAAS